MASGSSLFVYGTLLYPEIVGALLRRVPTQTPGLIKGYRRYGLNQFVFPAVVRQEACAVHGILLSGLSDQEMDILDYYEGDEYRRETVEVSILNPTKAMAETGETEDAIVYIWKDEYKHMLKGDWDQTGFEEKHIGSYVDLCQGIAAKEFY